MKLCCKKLFSSWYFLFFKSYLNYFSVTETFLFFSFQFSVSFPFLACLFPFYIHTCIVIGGWILMGTWKRSTASHDACTSAFVPCTECRYVCLCTIFMYVSVIGGRNLTSYTKACLFSILKPRALLWVFTLCNAYQLLVRAHV